MGKEVIRPFSCRAAAVFTGLVFFPEGLTKSQIDINDQSRMQLENPSKVTHTSQIQSDYFIWFKNGHLVSFG